MRRGETVEVRAFDDRLQQKFVLSLTVADRVRAIGDRASCFGRPYFVLSLTEGRSEEHTSELQSLMRISYAVFCLKKKTQQHKNKQKTKITIHYKSTHTPTNHKLKNQIPKSQST